MLIRFLSFLFFVMSVLLVALSYGPFTYAEDADVPDFFTTEQPGDFADLDEPTSVAPTQPTEKPIEKKLPSKSAAKPSPVKDPDAFPDDFDRIETPQPKTKPVAHKASSIGKGQGFRYLKADCSMRREPASASPEIIKVKGQRKLWVEKGAEGWYKGFRQNGDPGYLSVECFE